VQSLVALGASTVSAELGSSSDPAEPYGGGGVVRGQQAEEAAMPTDIPAHAPFTGEPGGEPEYAPGETGPETGPDAPQEIPDQAPFGDDGAAIPNPD
jgi:hypothetical protein